MIIEFLSESGEVIGTIRDDAGLVADGVAVELVEVAQGAFMTDAEIVEKYRDWSNGYERSRVATEGEG